MKGYLAILSIRMRALLHYRAAAFAGVCTQLFWGIVQVMIFKAFYSGASALEPMSLAQAVTFIWLGQCLVQLLPWTIDKEIEAQVKNGNVAYELIRPLHLYGLWYARSFAMRFIPTLMRCGPLFLIAGLLLDLSAPISWQAGVFFGIAVILALFLASAITNLMIISLFWTLSGEGLQKLLPHIAILLSGMAVPLPLFPQWMQPFLNIQPFRGVMDIPCRIYTGVILTADAPYYIGFQLAWTAALVLFGIWLMNKAVRKIVIQGG